MGLAWSVWLPLTSAGLREAPAGPGVYRIRAGEQALLYVGRSGSLASRLRTHARLEGWLGPVSFSAAALPDRSVAAQLLEVENDSIAGYYTRTGHAPAMQFGRDANGPTDDPRLG